MKYCAYTIQIFLSIFFGLLSRTFAQSDLRIEHLSTKQGLSVNWVFSICQDREGFMWFGTWYGIDKYDGYGFESHRRDPSSPQNGLLNNTINTIYEDEEGRLWAGTYYGLHLIDKVSGEITSFPDTNLNINFIFSITKGPNENLWVGSSNILSLFDTRASQFKVIHEFQKEGVPFIRINSLVQDASSQLWIGTNIGLYLYDPVKNFLTLLPVNDSPDYLSNITSLYLDNQNILWVGTGGEGIFTVNTNIDSLKPEPYNPENLINKVITGIIEDHDLLWIGTDNGLQRVNRKTNSIVTYRKDLSSDNSISHNAIQCIYLDRDENLWVCSRNGIDLIPSAVKPFYKYQLQRSSSIAVENAIPSVIVDNSRITWLRTPEGLVHLDSAMNQLRIYRFNPANPKVEKGDWVQAIYKDRKDRVWVGTNYGLQLYDPVLNKYIRYPFPSLFTYSSIAEDKEGKLWIGTETGLITFNPATMDYHLFQNISNDSTSLPGNFLKGAMASRTGDIWVFSSGWGVSRLDQQTGKFQHYFSGSDTAQKTVNDGDILDMFEDDEGVIWIGTSQGGLNRFDPQTETFSYFTTHDGLASNNIESIINDDHGNLWLGTNRGIMQFNPKDNSVICFDESDGLPGNSYNRQAKFKANKRLYFGGENGLVAFNPGEIEMNMQIPLIHISRFIIGNKQRPVTDHEIKLSYKENYLSFDFVSINYTAPEKNQYKYKLDGLDEDWVNAGSRRYASYSNLPPGDYTFHVIGSNNDGIWNDQGDSFTFTILPPWWRTTAAYVFYFLLFIAAIIIVDHIQRKRILNKERENSRERELEQAREIEKAYHELKSTQQQLIQSEKMASLGELTAGIAHEIQNPLNFVNNFSEVNKELIDEASQANVAGNVEDVKELLLTLTQNEEKIIYHGKKADGIVKNMLMHSRGGSGNKEPTDINALVDEHLRLSYHGMRANDKTFDSKFETYYNDNIEKINVVRQEIGRVVLNLINNAFYVVNEKAKENIPGFEPMVTVSTTKMEDKVQITVKDNGNGIPDSIKEKIFQPFFTTKPTGQGTGLGLSLSYDIVKAHGGKITVKSEDGKGTEFDIALPIK